jgi:maleate isomerase
MNATSAHRHDREYSARALLGVAVPQANPIVEPEFSALMPAGVGVIATRLQGSSADSGQRIVQYLDNLGASIEAFDSTKPDALGFACTGTSYLIGPDEERQRVDAYAERFGFPIITATRAILDACGFLGVARIALLAPYPQWLVDASLAYWKQCGLGVTDSTRTAMDASDTRAIYKIRAPMVIEAASALVTDDADAILISGTGMPSLRVMSQLALRSGKPVLSSNLCLAWALLRETGVPTDAPRTALGETLLGGWLERAAVL